MTEKRADELVKGDVLLIRGDRWTVMKAKVKGKHVHLVIDGRKGTFDQTVKGRSVYNRVGVADKTVPAGVKASVVRGHGVDSPENLERAGTVTSGPLLSPAGAQTRWATEGESTSWGVPASKGEARLIDRLGARLVAVEVEGGRLIVPPVDDSTIFGHLLTMHRVRFDGATLADAKAWAKTHSPAGAETLQDVIDGLSLQRAYAIHEGLHVDFGSLERPHWHREKAPA